MATPSIEALPNANGASTVSMTPAIATAISERPTPSSRSGSIVFITESFSCFAFAPVELLGFLGRPTRRSVERSGRRGNAIRDPDDGEPRARSELLVEPRPAEKADDDAQHDLDADRSVASDGFPVLLHSGKRSLAVLANPGAIVLSLDA